MARPALTPKDFQNAFHWAETQQNGAIPSFETRSNDPYKYQPGFNNNFESEAVPGTIPKGQNSPRAIRFGLYAEQITATAFVAPRHLNKKAWLYRARPAVAHQGFTDLEDNKDTESTFLPINPRVHISPTQLAWKPHPVPEGDVDFVDGLKTVAGSGDPTLREGLATHIYLCNKSMSNKAFVNSDGDFLIVPQQGALDIQTEFGFLYVQPGEICVLQRGQRFKVKVTRDDPWSITYKLGGKFFASTQNHSPFDVIAWHGNYVPFKYDLTKFVNVGSISVDHIDPSIFCVLTAKSRDPAAPLADFLIFSPRWDVASHTYRPPYYHRNAASELMGLIYGDYGGRSDEFQPGSISYECGHVPHGVAYEQFAAASKEDPPAMQISPGSIAFMFESCRPFTITDWAWNSKEKHEHDPKMWDDLVDNFSKFQVEVDEILAKAGKA
uniref:homogentisate 1,2-dioxygenase n=1 Tax=Bionectria ochroleuca TaxID=29856 RepID=A0A0B7KIP0_BIOOC